VPHQILKHDKRRVQKINHSEEGLHKSNVRISKIPKKNLRKTDDISHQQDIHMHSIYNKIEQ
jgi:hypothetical protein